MEFKKISMRAMILISTAVLLLLITLFSNHRLKNNEVVDDQIPPVSVLPAVSKQPEIIQHPVGRLEGDDEDEAVMKEMQGQMDADRNQQRQIKMLKMQLEQVNLQLENEKATAEINKLKREDAGYVKDSDTEGNSGFPSIKIIYIGGVETEKEAILSINGTSYSVKEKDWPVPNIEILGITDQGVKLHLNAPRQATTFINYVQE